MNLIGKPWKLSHLLHVLVFLTIVLPIVIVASIMLQMYRNDLVTQTTDKTIETLRAVTYSAEKEIQRALYAAAAIGTDTEVLTKASLVQQAEPEERQAYAIDLNKTIGRYSYSMSNYLLSIHFYFKQGGGYSYNHNLLLDESYARQSAWYRQALDQKDQVQLGQLQSNMLFHSSEDYVIPAAFAPSIYQGFHDVELIYFVFSRDAFENILLQNPFGSPSSYYILTEYGQRVASNIDLQLHHVLQDFPLNNIAAQEEGHVIYRQAGTDMLLTYTTMKTTGWMVMNLVPYRQIMQNYETVKQLTVFFVLVIALISFVVSVLLVRRITKPVHVLVRKMVHVMEGNLNARVEVSGSAEMVILGMTFNHMLNQMKRLREEHEAQERQKRKAEFDALQSQINPHFLINTLNAVKLMAIIQKADHIRQMTDALMRLVSSAFNRGGYLHRLSEEIENSKHYLYIMEFRYGKRFDVTWDIDEELTHCYLLKMLLQPIIENCIFHGFNGMEEGGVIEITGRAKDRCLLLTIADNGVGLSEAGVEQVEQGRWRQGFNGIGIMNIHHRIQLHYGEEFGLSIEPNDPRGTRVLLRIPYIEILEEE